MDELICNLEKIRFDSEEKLESIWLGLGQVEKASNRGTPTRLRRRTASDGRFSREVLDVNTIVTKIWELVGRADRNTH